MKTKHEIEYGHHAFIPAGTKVIPADNLPQPNDSMIAYWAELWDGMTESQKSHMRTYGFGIEEKDFTN